MGQHQDRIGWSFTLVLAEAAREEPMTQQTQNICITFIQRRPNVEDVGTTWYKCYTNVLCLLWTCPAWSSWSLRRHNQEIAMWAVGVTCRGLADQLTSPEHWPRKHTEPPIFMIHDITPNSALNIVPVFCLRIISQIVCPPSICIFIIFTHKQLLDSQSETSAARSGSKTG